MAHAYDTGATQAQRSAVRHAIVQRLAPLTKEQGLYLAAVRPFAKLVTSSDDDIAFVQEILNGQAPAVLVALGRKELEPRVMRSPMTSFAGTLTIGVFVVSTHNRAKETGRLAGDASAALANSNDPGIETILEHLEEMLIGYVPDVAGAHRLVPISEDEVVTFPDLSIWEQRYQCLVEREINPDRSITDLLTAIRGSHVLSERDDEIEIAETITPLEAP